MMASEFSVNECPPNTLSYRQYAYFEVTSDEPLDFVTDALDQQPIRFWNKGDLWVRGGREFWRRTSRWAMESDVKDSEPLEGHFAALLGRLEAVSDALRRMQDRHTCRIVCVSYNIQSFGFLLTAGTQARCAALGLDIEFDMYENVDPHDEILELRSLVSTVRKSNE